MDGRKLIAITLLLLVSLQTTKHVSATIPLDRLVGAIGLPNFERSLSSAFLPQPPAPTDFMKELGKMGNSMKQGCSSSDNVPSFINLGNSDTANENISSNTQKGEDLGNIFPSIKAAFGKL